MTKIVRADADITREFTRGRAETRQSPKNPQADQSRHEGLHNDHHSIDTG